MLTVSAKALLKKIFFSSFTAFGWNFFTHALNETGGWRSNGMSVDEDEASVNFLEENFDTLFGFIVFLAHESHEFCNNILISHETFKLIKLSGRDT